MNYRNQISEQIPSLEAIFTEYLKADALYHDQNKLPSNRITAYYLLFSEPITGDAPDEQKLLQTSVFNDSFIKELSQIDLTRDTAYVSPLLYYIMHLSEPFPTNSKYSQFLSNMFQKNFTGKAQPPQVRSILNAIDPVKLSKHIQNMIKKQLREGSHSSFERDIDQYIENVLQTERRLTEVCGLTGQESTSDCLTWILLYALFDDSSFENYCKEHIVPITPLSTQTANNANPNMVNIEKSNETLFLSKECWNSIFFTRLSIYILLILIALQMVGFVILMAFSNSDRISNTSFQLFCIIMLVASVCLFVLRYIPYYFAQRTADFKIRLNHHESSSVSSLLRTEVNPLSNVDQNSYGNKGRSYTVIVMLALWVIVFVISLIFENFTIFFSGAILAFLAFLIVDHTANALKNNYDYAELFGGEDAQKLHSKYAKEQYGLALRYVWDYDFENDTFRHKNVAELNDHSIDCIRFIFSQHAGRQKYLWTSYTILSLIFDLIVLFLALVQYFLPENNYFQIANHTAFMIFAIAWIFVSDLIFVVLLLQTERHYETLAEFEDYNKANYTDAYLRKSYHNAYNTGRLTNIDVSRGVHLYSRYCYIEKKASTTEIQNINDRPIVIHRYHDAQERCTICYIGVTLSYLCLVVWNLQFLPGLLALPVLVILCSNSCLGLMTAI